MKKTDISVLVAKDAGGWVIPCLLQICQDEFHGSYSRNEQRVKSSKNLIGEKIHLDANQAPVIKRYRNFVSRKINKQISFWKKGKKFKHYNCIVQFLKKICPWGIFCFQYYLQIVLPLARKYDDAQHICNRGDFFHNLTSMSCTDFFPLASVPLSLCYRVLALEWWLAEVSHPSQWKEEVHTFQSACKCHTTIKVKFV